MRNRRTSRPGRLATPRTAACLVSLALWLLPGTSGRAQQPTPSNAPAIEKRDEWRVLYFEGKRVGVERTRYESDSETVTAVRETNVTGGSRRFTSRFSVRTDPTGLLRDFDFSVSLRQGRGHRQQGEMRDGAMHLTTSESGRSTNYQKTWPQDTRSPLWFEWQLPGRPLPPRHRLRYRGFEPQSADQCRIELTSSNWRKVPLPDGTRPRLLPLTVKRSDRPGIVWRWYLDDAGQVVLSEDDYDGVRLQKQLVPRAIAQAGADNKSLDLRLARLVRTKRPLATGRHVKQAVFRVRGAAGLAGTLNHAPRQLAREATDGAVELTVQGTELTTARNHRRVDRKYLKASRLIDYNEPNVQRFAAEAAGAEFDPARVAVNLQQAVDRLVRNRVFSTTTTPASEIVLRREGDCTEHAVLLAALLRARRIPARIAVGFAYVDGRSGFAPHMWTEANINGEWTALDASHSRKLPGGGYIQVSHSALADDETVIDAFLPLLDLIDRLEIEIVRSDNGSELR